MTNPIGMLPDQAQPEISFRAFADEDIQLMLEWLQRPHVKRWWDDGDDSLEDVQGSYSSDWGGARYILQLDEVDAGYFQYEVESSGLIGIDLFIADGDSLDRGVGTRTVGAFVELVSKLEKAERVQVDPNPENARAIRCFEKVGFRHTATMPGLEGGMAYFMVLDLEQQGA